MTTWNEENNYYITSKIYSSNSKNLQDRLSPKMTLIVNRIESDCDSPTNYLESSQRQLELE